MNLEELYKDTILYHGRNTENKREVSFNRKLSFEVGGGQLCPS